MTQRAGKTRGRNKASGAQDLAHQAVSSGHVHAAAQAFLRACSYTRVKAYTMTGSVLGGSDDSVSAILRNAIDLFNTAVSLLHKTMSSKVLKNSILRKRGRYSADLSLSSGAFCLPSRRDPSHSQLHRGRFHPTREISHVSCCGAGARLCRAHCRGSGPRSYVARLRRSHAS